jgi:TonB family protein
MRCSRAVVRWIGGDVACVVSLLLMAALPAAAGYQSPARLPNEDELRERVARARDLYLSAAYDDALALLAEVQPSATPRAAMEAGQYRVFCLVALDRDADAKAMMEQMVSADPMYRLPEDTPPRIRSSYEQVRRSLLPVLVNSWYAVGKLAFDAKDFGAAVKKFSDVLALLNDPELKSVPTFVDLRTVVAGFRDLSEAAAHAAASAPPAVALPAPTAAENSPKPPADNKTVAVRPITITPPVPISQPLPRWRPNWPIVRDRKIQATLVVTIDARGGVKSATIERGVYPAYDEELRKLALTWRFKPALRNGVPTDFEKNITIQVEPAK